MKAYDTEYASIFKELKDKKDELLLTIENHNKIEELDKGIESIIYKFATIYDWEDYQITLTNNDDCDIESMLDDLKNYKCDTFADFSILYMQEFIKMLDEVIKD